MCSSTPKAPELDPAPPPPPPAASAKMKDAPTVDTTTSASGMPVRRKTGYQSLRINRASGLTVPK